MSTHLTQRTKFDNQLDSSSGQTTLWTYFDSSSRAQAMSHSDLRARAAAQVRSGQWNALQEDRELCSYLAHHCMKCGRWFTRGRELVAHLREAHPQVMIPGIDRMLALQREHVRVSPCPFCELSWTQQHGCPILLQFAILQDESSALSSTEKPSSDALPSAGNGERSLSGSTSSWSCHLCMVQCSTRAQLTEHLQEHQLQLHRFDPQQRDSVEGEPACSHCGLLVTILDALRNHITKGHCKHFDPRKPVTEVAIGPTLREALLSGRLGPYLCDAGARTTLTVKCLCCGRTYPGARELSRHLQDRHSILWNEALHLGLSLKQVISPLSGCICNPAVATMTPRHECVGLRQLAMTHIRLYDTLLVPWMLRQLLRPGVIPAPLVHDVHNWLIDRQFHKLWECVDLLHILSSHCILCDFHGRGDELQLHLLIEHHCQERGLMMFVHQMIRALANPSSDSLGCVYCGMAREDLQAHPACPTLNQISLILSFPIHERFWFGPHGGQFHGAIIGGAPTLGPISGSGKRAGSVEASSNRPKQARSNSSGKGASSTRPSLGHGTANAETRTGPSIHGTAGHIPPVGSQEGSLPLLQAAHRAWSDQKERTTNLRTHLILTMLRELQRRLLKLMSGADNDPIKVALVKNGILLEDHTWPYMQWDMKEKRLIYNKTRTPVTMNVTQEMLEEMLTLVKEDGAIQKFHSLSKPEDSKSQPWRLQVGLRNDRLHKLFTQSCEPMADHRHSNEAALVEGIPPRPEGQGYDAAPVMTAEHGRIAMLIAKWELLNPANHCFANSSMLAMVWACLHRVHFATADWGALQLGLEAMLQQSATPFVLLGIEQFGDLFAHWWNPTAGCS